MSYQLPTQTSPDPFYDLRLESQNYWAGRTGQEDPPPPTYRKINGEMKLGRYMDPYGCACHCQSVKREWQDWWISYLLPIGASLIFIPITFFAIFLVLPFAGGWYWWNRKRHQEQYDLYYKTMERIVKTGEPEWVPYDKKRLRLIEHRPLAVWP